ncbi:hypothetical protein BDB13_1517 [Rhodococcus sp. OK302]|nr:hypothetical protein BDB13_1517 [Rhodococcus sp. OK302]
MEVESGGVVPRRTPRSIVARSLLRLRPRRPPLPWFLLRYGIARTVPVPADAGGLPIFIMSTSSTAWDVATTG